MFPLKVVLFPGEQSALHIFEPRYRELLHDIEQSGGQFGIPYPESKNEMHWCSIVSLVAVTKRHPGGESDIVIAGEEIGRMRSFDDPAQGKLYAVGSVDVMSQITSNLANEKVIEELYELRNIIGPKADMLLSDEYRYLYRIISSLGLSTEQKLKYLKLNDAEARQLHVANLLKFTRLIVQQEQQIDNGVFPN
jgi:Lon protease-like protein